MKNKNIIVVIKNPNEDPFVKRIPNTLEAMQEIVGGLIEIIRVGGKTVIVINEEGKLFDLERNFDLGDDCMVGSAFFCSETDDGEFDSLTDNQIINTFCYLAKNTPPKNEPIIGFQITFF